MRNLAALRAAVFTLSGKPSGGGGGYPPPSVRGLNIQMQTCKRRAICKLKRHQTWRDIKRHAENSKHKNYFFGTPKSPRIWIDLRGCPIGSWGDKLACPCPLALAPVATLMLTEFTHDLIVPTNQFNFCLVFYGLPDLVFLYLATALLRCSPKLLGTITITITLNYYSEHRGLPKILRGRRKI